MRSVLVCNVSISTIKYNEYNDLHKLLPLSIPKCRRIYTAPYRYLFSYKVLLPIDRSGKANKKNLNLTAKYLVEINAELGKIKKRK